MDRRHLEYFVAVAEQGSFTRAAAALSIAQPSLSHAIALLERDLGSQLFDRNGRGSRLTPEGEALLEPARQALRSFQAARGAVRAVSEGGFGQLSIITNTLWAVDPLSLMIGRFRALHPHVQVTVTDPGRRSARTMVDERLEEAGRPGEVAVETAHLASVVPMVLAGAGAALLPQGLAAYAAVKGARLLRLEPPARASVPLLWREGRLSALARQFVDVATGGPTDGAR